jgi:hypothetical protein
MKTYEFIQPSGGDDISGEPEYIRKTEEEILEEYWPWWREKMVKKHGEGHYLIQPEVCIEDWAVTHYAYEVKT